MSCKEYLKNIDPTCEDQEGCEWVVGSGCVGNRSRSPPRVNTKLSCSSYRKNTKGKPKCGDQEGCEWVVGSGCVGNRHRSPPRVNTKLSCSGYRKNTKGKPKCEDQEGCEWVVGDGCRWVGVDSEVDEGKDGGVDYEGDDRILDHHDDGDYEDYDDGDYEYDLDGDDDYDDGDSEDDPDRYGDEDDQDGADVRKPVKRFGPFVNKLTGLREVQYYTGLPRNRTILLLGENHDTDHGCDSCLQRKEGCWLVTDYIKQLDRSRQECIDFFIEDAKILGYDQYRDITSVQGGAKSRGNYQIESIETLRSNFTDQEVAYLNRIYPHTRFHHWDLRQFRPRGRGIQPRDTESILNLWLVVGQGRYTSKLQRYFNKTTQAIDLQTKMRYFYNYYVTGENLRNSEKFIDDLLHVSGYSPQEIKTNKRRAAYIRYKVQKEVDKIDPELEPYFAGENLYSLYFDIWFEQLRGNLRYYPPFKPLSGEDIDTILRQVGLFVTDIYLFARIFIKFSDSKATTVIGCQNPVYQYPKNIIVYGGAGHIRMINLITSRLFGLPNIDKSSPHLESCIEFDRPVQFF